MAAGNNQDTPLEQATSNQRLSAIPEACVEEVDLSGGADYERDHEREEPATGQRRVSIAPDLPAGELVSGGPKEVKRNGMFRHLIAVLALSSVIMGYIHRQTFNQSLPQMERKRKPDASVFASSEPFEVNTGLPPLIDELQSGGALDWTPTSPLFANESSTEPSTTTTLGASSPNDSEGGRDSRRQAHHHDDQDEDEDRFDWTRSDIGLLQAAFSYGYTPFMIPGGRMAEIYGAKWIVFVSGFGSSVCYLVAPYLADHSLPLLVASRVLMGLCQTAVSPSLFALLTRWLPPDESCVYLPMIKVGVMVGLSLGSLMGGLFRWRVSFYVTAAIGFVWSLMWALCVTSDPEEHTFLDENELAYIKQEITRHNKGRRQSTGAAKRKSAPWLQIFLNPVVIALVVTKFTIKLSTDVQAMQMPFYLKDVFRMSAGLNSSLNGMNYAIQGVFTGMIAYLARECVSRKVFGLSKTGVRRSFQSICSFGMAAAYVLVTFNMGSIYVIVVAFLLLSVSSMFGSGGETVLPVDLSTEYTASIMAIANSVANLSGIVLPPIVAFILGSDKENPERWNLIWFMLAGVLVAGGICFDCLVHAEIQDFKRAPREDTAKTRRDTSKWIPSDDECTVVEMKVTPHKRQSDN